MSTFEAMAPGFLARHQKGDTEKQVPFTKRSRIITVARIERTNESRNGGRSNTHDS